MAEAAGTHERQGVYQPILDGALLSMEADLLQNDALRLASFEHDAAVKAQELIKRVGNIALSSEMISSEPTLYEAIRSGNRAFIEENARTDVIERTFKAGHIMKVRQRLNGRGQIEQHGQTSEQTQINTLRYANANPLMKPRVRAETKNMYYIDLLRRSGLLEENYAVVVSLCPNADNTTLDKLGFFSFSKSLAIQATTVEQGDITTESAFIAGVKHDGTERYDHKTAVDFGKRFGEDWRGLNDAQIISRVLLIPKSSMPNGVIDLAQVWDDLAGGTFFGRDVPRQDYGRYLQLCRQREQGFEPAVQKIVSDLISIAPTLEGPLDAVEALHKISEKHTLDKALTDRTIDPRVFGAKAALDLEEARFHYDRGNVQLVQLSMHKALKNAASGSCASGAAGGETSMFNEDGTLKTPEQILSEKGESQEESDQFGSLSFRCQRGHRNTRPRGKLIPNCMHCGISVGCGPKKSLEKKRGTNITHSANGLGGLIAPAFWQKFDVTSKQTNAAPKKVSAPVRSDFGLAA